MKLPELGLDQTRPEWRDDGQQGAEAPADSLGEALVLPGASRSEKRRGCRRARGGSEPDPQLHIPLWPLTGPPRGSRCGLYASPFLAINWGIDCPADGGALSSSELRNVNAQHPS